MATTLLAYQLASELEQWVIDALEAQGVKDITQEMVEEVLYLHGEGLSIMSGARLVRADWTHELRAKTVFELNTEVQTLLEARGWKPAREGENSRLDAIRTELKRRITEAQEAAAKAFDSVTPVYEGDGFIVNTDRLI